MFALRSVLPPVDCTVLPPVGCTAAAVVSILEYICHCSAVETLEPICIYVLCYVTYIAQVLISHHLGAPVKPPAATGPHWENIGFQGMDPCTDLNRAMRMFAVLQMLHLVDTLPSLACSWHGMSESYRTEEQRATATAVNGGRGGGITDNSWPFMCVSVMFTKEVIQGMRSGILNAKCNKHKDVLKVLHDYHHALFFEFVR